MKTILYIVLLSTAAWTVWAGPSAAWGAELQAGVAVVDVTPPLGYRMSGYFYERLSTGVHDPLFAKAIVLRQGDRQAALVFCDIIGMSPEVSGRARRLAEQKTGIPAANVMIAATHSHTGPLYFGALRERFRRERIAAEGSDTREPVDYAASLVQKLVEVIVAARAATAPVKLQAGVARQEGLAFNRRFHMKDGSVRFNPGVLNPNIVRPAGPIDPQVGMVLLLNVENSRPLASLTVFALHLDTVGGTQYSADYPYYLEQSLRGMLGREFVSLFGNGTCGDINHIDVSRPRPKRKRHEETRHIGETLAATVKARLPKLEAVKGPSLAVRREIVDVPLQQYDAEQVARAESTMQKVGSSAVPFLERVEAYKIAAIKRRGGQTLPIEVQAFRLGEGLAIVALPGEVFVELGLAIKRGSPFATTLVIELANDAPGYIPTAKAFREGSYETVNSRIRPGGGEKVVETALRLLSQLSVAGSGRQ